MSIPLVLKTDNVDFYANTSKILTTTNCSETVTTIVNGVLNPPYEYDWNVNNYANLDYLLTTNGFNKDPQQFTVYLHEKNSPYLELISKSELPDKFDQYVSMKNTIQNIRASNYFITQNSDISNEEFTIINENQYTLMNQSYINMLYPYQLGKSISIIDKVTGLIGNINTTFVLNSRLSVYSPEPYTFGLDDRTSAYVYEPGNTVYLLINTVDKQIFIMQTYKNKYKNIGLHNIIYLDDYLNDPSYVSVLLPSQFMFTYVSLDDKSMLLLMTNPDSNPAYVLTDGLQNTYQFVRYEEAPFLYDSFFITTLGPGGGGGGRLPGRTPPDVQRLR